MRRADLGREAVLVERGFDAQHEIIRICLVVGVLELTPAAFRKVTAWRHLMVRAEGKRPIVKYCVTGNAERHVTAACRHSIATGGDADDQLVHSILASACGITAARSSAI